jgi:hypothetical protein
MMILDMGKQLADRDLCRQMADLGADTEAQLDWLIQVDPNYKQRVALMWHSEHAPSHFYNAERVPAYSVPELLEMFPDLVSLHREPMPAKGDSYYWAEHALYAEAETAADCLAKLWIALHTPNPLTTDTETT